MDPKPSPQSSLFDFHLDDLWPILRKQRNVVLLFFGTVVTATLVGGLLQTPEYRASTTILVSPRAGQEVAVNEPVDYTTRGYFEIQQFFRTQIQIILSRSVREEVIRRYVALGYDDLTLEQDGAAKLGRAMHVVPEEQSQLVTISVEHTDPERAAALANLVAEVYSEANLAARREASADATTWLEQQIAEYEVAVARAEAALHDYKARTQLVDTEERINTLGARMASLNEAYGARTTELVLLETTLKAHEDLLAKGRWEDLAKVLESPLLHQAARDYATAVSEEQRLAARYGEKHTERVQARARMDGLAEAMRVEVRRLIDAERARAEVLRREVASLEAEIEAAKNDMLEYQRKGQDYLALQAELERARSFYAKLSDRLEEVRLAARTQLNNVRIVDPALTPRSPYRPNVPMSVAIGAVVGLLGGVGLALLREYVDDTITSQLDVAAYLKVPFLGLVPRLPEGVVGRQADLFTHEQPRSSVAEAVRGVRAMIEMNPQEPSPRRVLVTSSVAREGKTSTALRLAISYAQMGKRVVLIDADLRRPRLHKVFGERNDVGLTSFVVGAAEAADLPVATSIPNLWLIQSGPSSDHPAELMASPRMEDLFATLEQRFDIILVDTPPSVALSDAVTLSRRVDGIVLVVKEQEVARAVVKQTIDLFRQVDATILGVVLNHVDLHRSGSKYKYYYAYRDYYATYGDGTPASDGSEKAAK